MRKFAKAVSPLFYGGCLMPADSNQSTEQQCSHDHSMALLVDRYQAWRKYDCPYCEIDRLRADLAIQAVNAKTVTDLQEEIARLNAVGRLRFSDDAPAPRVNEHGVEIPCCHKCTPQKGFNALMILCPTCGNKRCPKASDHTLACTNSNEPGQPGSIY